MTVTIRVLDLKKDCETVGEISLNVTFSNAENLERYYNNSELITIEELYGESGRANYGQRKELERFNKYLTNGKFIRSRGGFIRLRNRFVIDANRSYIV